MPRWAEHEHGQMWHMGTCGSDMPGGSLSVPVGSNFVPVSEHCGQRAQVT